LKTLPLYLDEWIKDKQLLLAGQSNSWIDNVTFKSYCMELVKFINLQRQKYQVDKKTKFLLLLDSYSSREDSKTLEFLKNNNCKVIAFPSHCSHVLQVLDLGLHMRFKCFFKKERRIAMRESEKGTVNLEKLDSSEKAKARVIHIVAAKRALHSAIESGRIMDAFKVAGFFPSDKAKALQNPYVRIVSEDEHSEPMDLSSSRRKRVSISGSSHLRYSRCSFE